VNVTVNQLGISKRALLWRFGLAVVQVLLLVLHGELLAQEIPAGVRDLFLRVPQGRIQDDLLNQDIEILGRPGAMGGPANLQQANAKPLLLKQMRGLIQNELTIINGLCNLNPKQKQTLVDLAEGDWKAKTNTSIIKRTQEHVYGSIDLDGLAERVVRTWIESVGTVEQLSKYDEELADRMKWRQKALVSKLLDILAEKLNLSGVQMTQIEEVLNEKWKDRWFRSLEATFENTSLLPEIRPSWITPLLSDSQRAAFVTQDQQMMFGAQQTSKDSPSLALEQRFHVGDAISSDEIEVVPVPKKTSPVDKILEKAEMQEKAKSDVEDGTVDAKKP
jgi:hypothetical protein